MTTYLPPLLATPHPLKKLAAAKTSSRGGLCKIELPDGQSVITNGQWALYAGHPVAAALVGATDKPVLDFPQGAHLFAQWIEEAKQSGEHLRPYAVSEDKTLLIAATVKPDAIPRGFHAGVVLGLVKLGLSVWDTGRDDRVALVDAGGAVVGILATAPRREFTEGWRECGASDWPLPAKPKKEKAAKTPAELARAACVNMLIEAAIELPDKAALKVNTTGYDHTAYSLSRGGKLIEWKRPTGITRYRVHHQQGALLLADKIAKLPRASIQ
jgi:hypothetical protein